MMNARRLTIVLAVSIAVGVAAGAASAYWTGFDTALHGTGAASAGSVNQGAAPTADSHGTNVVLSWGASSLSTGDPVDGYIVKRYDAGTNAPQTMRTNCMGTIAANTCTELNMPAGDWKYTVTPIAGANWRGPESDHSGVVGTGPTVLELNRGVVGPPLPTQIGGTVTGFAPNEGISYKLDGATIAGSPSSVGANGSATINSLTIPAGTSDGPHTIAAVGNDPVAPSNAEASILVDTTPPTIAPFITPPPNAAGWNNTSPVEVSATVDDGNGSGLAYAKYTDDGTDPKTSPSSKFATAPLSIAATTTLNYFVADLAGNQSPVETLPVKIDTTPPFFTVALVDVQGGVYTGPPGPQGQPGTNYYRGADAGSLRFEVTPVPTGGSAAVSAGFSPLSADTSGFSFDSTSVTTPVGGPFLSNPISWVAGTDSTPSGSVTLLDAAGNTFGDSGSLINDSTAPSGGSVDASGLSGTGGRYSTLLALSLNLAKGSDAGTGLADGSAPTDTPSQLLRASAPLTSSGTVNGSCGTYGAYVQVGSDNPSSTIADTVPTDATCYRYRYLVPDHIGNVAAYTSPDIKVMTTTFASVRPTDATITPVSGISAQSVSASTVFYNPALSGSFNVDSSASASVAGIAQMTFPALAGFTGGGAVTTPNTGTTYRTTYAWSGNGSSPSPGVQALSATNNAGNTRSNDTAFSVVKDDVAPGGGSVDATGLGGTGGRYSTSTTLSLGLTPGADTGSGLATTGRKLLRASASLTSDGTSDGSCGTFGAYTQVGADDPATPKSDTVPVDRLCYRYRYVVPDKVGNQATYTSPDIKVEAAAPPAPGLTFSNLSNATSTGNSVFYRPGANSGGFTVNATSADTTSGTTGYGFPTLPAGWSASSGGPGIQNYSWSAPNPTVPSGAQTVTTTNNAGRQSSATFTVATTSDNTAPSGGTITYTNGLTNSSFINVSFTKGTDTGGSGLNAASGVLQRSSATFSNGSCGSFGAFVTVATNPISPNANSVGTGCYQYRYLISDNVGNQATYTSPSVVKDDQVFPTNTLSLTGTTSASLAFAGASLYYKGDTPGSFRFVNAVGDAESGPASTTFPAIATTGWTHNAETVTTPAGGPYTSSVYSWSANPGNPALLYLTGTDAAGNGWNKAVGFASDTTPPAFGGIVYANAVVNAAAVPITLSLGSDVGSGVEPTTTIVKRDVAPLTTATETCGAFPGTYPTTVTLVGGADTSVSSGNCYQYRYIVSDKVGNVTTYTSASVAKVDTNGPRLTAITSQQSGGGAGNGQLQVGDRLILSFNQSLATASVPATFSGASETSPGLFSNVTLAIPGIANGTVDTGSLLYVASLTSASFGGTVTLINNGTATTATLIVTSVSGLPLASSGALAFTPAATITDGGGNAAAGTFTTAGFFKLF